MVIAVLGMNLSVGGSLYEPPTLRFIPKTATPEHDATA